MDSSLARSSVNSIVAALRSAAGLMILGTIALAAVVTIDKGPYIIVNTIVTGGMWALMAMGLALVFGVMNIAHFAVGEIFMAGSLVAYYTITPIMNYRQRTLTPRW